MRSVNGRRGSARWGWALLGVAALAVAGCGTHLPNSAFVNSGQNGGAGRAGGSGSAGGGGSSAGGTGGQVGGVASSAGGGALSGGGGTSGGGGSGGSTGGGGSTSGGRAATSGGSTGGSGAPGNTASDVGITPTSITVGNITAIGGPLGPEVFSPSLYGATAYFDALNASGGVNGRKINFITCDDQENPNQDVACAQKLIQQDKVFAFVGNDSDNETSATYTNSQAVPDMADFCIGNACSQYPHVFQLTGNHYPRNGKVGFNGTLYAATQTFAWFKQHLGVSRAADFFYSIPISRQAGLLFAQLLKDVGIQVVYYGGGSDQGENPAAPTYDTDVIQMRNNRVDIVVDAIDIGGLAKLCQSMDRFGFTVKANITTSQGMGQFLGSSFSAPCRDSVYAADLTVPYTDTSNPEVAAMRAAMKKYEPSAQLHQWALDGWAAAAQFTDAVRSMGASVTRSGLERWLTSGGGVGYNDHGLLAAPEFGFQIWDYSRPQPYCASISQWQDSAGEYVERQPLSCVTSSQMGYQASNTGGS